MRLALAQESPSPLRLHVQVRISVGFSLTTSLQGTFLAEALVLVVCQAVLNSVPSIHIRCMMTASFRARAILARFAPRRAATRIAHALSGVHLVVLTSITCAASYSTARTLASPALVIDVTRSVSPD